MKRFLLFLIGIVVFSGVFAQPCPDVLAPPPVSVVSVNAQAAIPTTGTSGPATIPFTLAGGPAQFSDVNITSRMCHTWVGDLTIQLQAPNGATFTLLTAGGGGGSRNLAETNPVTYGDGQGPTNLGTVPTVTVTSSCATVAALTVATTGFKTTGLTAWMSALPTVNGNWNLLVNDAVGGDSGNLAANGLTFSFQPLDTNPCRLVCSGDINASLTNCTGFTIPAKSVLAHLEGFCPRQVVPISNGFTGAFATPIAYDVFVNATLPNYNGNPECVDFNPPTTLTMENGNPGSNTCFWNQTVVSFVVPQDGFIQFDWNTSSLDPGWDEFGYAVTTPVGGPNTLASINAILANEVVLDGLNGPLGPGALLGSGTTTASASAGQVFSFVCSQAAGFNSIQAVISNLKYFANKCPEVVQIQGPAPGSVVGAGVYNMKFEGIDPFGNSLGKCTFRINVTAQQPNLTCNDHLNISVNQSCQVTLVPDMLLENYEALTASGCTNGSFDIRVWPFGNEQAATGNVNGVATTFPRGTHTYEIRHPFGQKCWGTFTVEDKLAPVINCGAIRDIQCFEVDALLAEDVTKKATPATARFAPSWADNCGATTAEFSTAKINVTNCGGGSVARTWIVTDAAGNTASCVQHFNVVRNFQWSCPAPLVVLECKEETTAKYIADTYGVEYAYPHTSINGQFVSVDGVCGLYSTVEEVEIDACAPHCHGNKKVLRDWRILDWCTGRVTNCSQIIKTIDLDAPTAILKDTIVSTAPWYCEGDFFVPNPWELHDNCDANPTWTVRVTTAGAQVVPALLNGKPHPLYKYRVIGLAKGTHTLVYTLSDCCDNERSITSSVTVVDRTPPVPVVYRDIVVGLTPHTDANGVTDGAAKIFCKNIDNGSYDNCSPVRCEVRRPAGSPACGNLGRAFTGTGNVDGFYNNNVTYSNNFPANLANNMPFDANDTDEGEFVKFCCTDLTSASGDFDGDGTNDEGYHQVIMRVWDDGNMDGIIGNTGDNWNESWCNVKVECKVPPTIVCPPNATIHCDWPIDKFIGSPTNTKSVDDYNFSKTGLPTAYGVCQNLAIRFYDTQVLNDCGIGRITRTFLIREKDQTRTCVQLIDVLPSLSVQPWTINLPSDWADIVQVSCDGPTDEQIAAAAPSHTTGPCDVIGTNIVKDQYDFELGVCRKWKVTYNYTNWCTNENRGGFEKYFMYRDTEAPVIDCENTMYAVDNNCEYNGTLTNSATDNGGCIANNPDRWLKWTVFVDLWADGTNDFEWSSFLPANNDVLNMNNGNWGAIVDDNGNGVPDIYVAPTKDGANVAGIKLPTIEGKMSNHKVVWKVTDGCHNFSSCSESFMVVDKKAPTPVCIPLTTALMADPDGNGPALPMVELWAIDFMNKAYDNCTDSDDLLYTFENVAPRVTDTLLSGPSYIRDGSPVNLINIDKAHYFDPSGKVLAPYPIRLQGVNPFAADKTIQDKYLRGEDGLQLWLPANHSSAKVWSSTSLTPGADHTDLDVKVTVWDKKFNHDYCWTVLSLRNIDPNTGSRIVGKVQTPNGTLAENVAVTVKGAAAEDVKTEKTSNIGSYTHETKANMSYEVTASKGGDYLNGVSTLDLVMIQRHILGITAFDSPYKVIAADANNDNKITSADLTELRKLILGVTSELPNQASWRMPVMDQTFSANILPYVEKYVVVNNASGRDFAAVKIGDVNGNVVVNAQSDVLESRTNTNIQFSVANATVKVGEVIEIPVTSSNFADVYGYQMTMNLNGASLVSVKEGAIDMNASNVATLANGAVTVSYANANAVTASSNDVLFTLVVKADKSTSVAEMLSVNSDVVKAESYVGDMQVGKVSLAVRTAPVAEITLFQNEPNPFKASTNVSFDMPSAAKVTLTIADVTGKVVAVKNIDATRGVNTIAVNRSEVGTTGVLFYTLTSGDFTATKKMIIVE